MPIPQESQLPSKSDSASMPSTLESADASAHDSVLDAVSAAMAEIHSTHAADTQVASTQASSTQAADTSGPPSVAVEPARDADIPLFDPISEEPSAMWYVRPPSGAQFGPASGEVMRRWINEGRICSDSLVWREGWPNWRKAESQFPELDESDSSTSSIMLGDASEAAAEAGELSTSDAPSTVDRYRSRRRSSRSLAVTAVVILGLLSVVLVVVFIGMIVAG